MKELFAMVATLLTMSCMCYAENVNLDEDLKAALPSGEYFLPGPPEVGSLIWQDDSVKYFQYKEASRVINPETQDRWDSCWAKLNEPYDFALFRLSADSVMNAPFIEASWTHSANNKYTVTKTRNTTDFPEMNKLEQLCEEMKEQGTSQLWRTRPRPYFYFSDWYGSTHYDSSKPDSFQSSLASSYPSGHGYFAGLFGMAMLYIDPANALAIKKMIDEWAECRLILGAHWNTDIEAGKVLGAIAFAIAMNYDQFRKQVEAAKAELEAYRARSEDTPTDVESVNEERLEVQGKMLRDGQLIIEHNGNTYSAQGQTVRY